MHKKKATPKRMVLASSSFHEQQLAPPYPLSHLERRALQRGEWTLVWNQVDEKVYFFNPRTRQATRHLQPLLLSSSSSDGGTAPRNHHTSMPLSAALPPVPPADTVESLRAALATKTSELATSDALVRSLQNEQLLLKYALLQSRGSATSHATPPPLLLCARCQQSEVPTATALMSSALHAISSDALNVLIASPLKALHVEPPHVSSEYLNSPPTLFREEDASHRLLSVSHTPLSLQFQSVAGDGTPSKGVVATERDSHQQQLQLRVAMLERQLEAMSSLHLELLTHVQSQR